MYRMPRSATAMRFDAAIRLATWYSMAAVMFAVAAHLAGVSERVVVVSVLTVGFVASLRRTAGPVPARPAGALERMPVGTPTGG